VTPDVLVIGAGAAGLCCAYFLRRAGRSVTVLDRAGIADPASCSSGNTGFVAHGGAPLTDVRALLRAGRPVPDRDALRWLWLLHRARESAPAGRATLVALKHRSIAILRELCADGDLARAFTVSGMVVAFRTPQGFRAARATVPAAAAAGIPVRELSPGELRGLEPGTAFTVPAALYQDGCGYLDPARFLGALAALLRGMGVDIREHTAVLGFDASRERVWRVRTTAGDVAPGETVLAAGTGSARLARLLDVAVPLRPLKGYAVTVPAPPGTPRGPVLLSEDSVAVRPLDGRLRVAGGLELAGDRSVSRRAVAGLLRTVHAYLPALDLGGPREVWTGLRPSTPDSLPYLGRTGRYADLTVAFGHGHVGMGLAPAAGELVAQLVTGQPTELDVRPFRTDRFVGRPA
jgi:D-amino-acid dehydrogenase